MRILSDTIGYVFAPAPASPSFAKNRWCRGTTSVNAEGGIMRTLLFIIAVACVGCAATKSPERWVENNTLYSTKLPAIEVKVSTSLSYNKTKAEGSIAESDKGNSHSGLDTEWFYFSDSTNKAQLSIDIETLNTHTDWYMEPPDYSKSSSLMSDHEKIGDINFATGILRKNISGVPLLIKAYGAVAGETTRYSLLYMEIVDNNWLDKHSALLTSSERDFLSEFNKRADASFSISPYSGKPSPTQ